MTTAEPTDLPTGREIRDALAGKTPKTALEMAEMFSVDRAIHNNHHEAGINAALEKGISVISDRYYYSSCAYQGMDTDLDWVMNMNLNCPDILKPDLCIFLDLDAQSSKKRIDSNRATVEIFEDSTKTLDTIRNKFFEVFSRFFQTRFFFISSSASHGIASLLYHIPSHFVKSFFKLFPLFSRFFLLSPT